MWTWTSPSSQNFQQKSNWGFPLPPPVPGQITLLDFTINCLTAQSKYLKKYAASLIASQLTRKGHFMFFTWHQQSPFLANPRGCHLRAAMFFYVLPLRMKIPSGEFSMRLYWRFNSFLGAFFFWTLSNPLQKLPDLHYQPWEASHAGSEVEQMNELSQPLPALPAPGQQGSQKNTHGLLATTKRQLQTPSTQNESRKTPTLKLSQQATFKHETTRQVAAEQGWRKADKSSLLGLVLPPQNNHKVQF